MYNKRLVRMHKDYLFQKSKEAQDQARFDKRQKLRDALDGDKKLPDDIKKQAHTLRKEFLYDDGLPRPARAIDNEYANAGEVPPRILITTSRDPSTRLQQFAKEVRLIFPNSQRINRGAYVLRDLVDACRSNDVTDLVMLHEHRGNPDAMVVSHFPHGPTVYFTLHNVVLRHDIENSGTVSEAYPHLIFDGFGNISEATGGAPGPSSTTSEEHADDASGRPSTAVGRRVVQVLKHLFPVPKSESRRVLTFANRGDFVSFRHHVFQECAPGAQVNGTSGGIAKEPVAIAEVGPRFEMRPFKIIQGTVDVREADVEWMLRPYQRTARKRNVM